MSFKTVIFGFIGSFIVGVVAIFLPLKFSSDFRSMLKMNSYELSMIEKYEDINKQLENEIVVKDSKLEDLKTDNEEINNICIKLNQDIATLQVETMKLEHKISILKEENSVYENKIGTCEDELNNIIVNSELELKKLEDELERLNALLETKEEELSKIQYAMQEYDYYVSVTSAKEWTIYLDNYTTDRYRFVSEDKKDTPYCSAVWYKNNIEHFKKINGNISFVVDDIELYRFYDPTLDLVIYEHCRNVDTYFGSTYEVVGVKSITYVDNQGIEIDLDSLSDVKAYNVIPVEWSCDINEYGEFINLNMTFLVC